MSNETTNGSPAISAAIEGMQSINRKVRYLKGTIVACTALIIWSQAGFPNPVSWLNTPTWTSAQDQCIQFAKKRNIFPDKQLKIGDTWTKNSKKVLEVIASTPGETSLDTRLCVVSEHSVKFVSQLEEGFWQ